MINALIVDDEPLAREILETFIKKLPDWEVVASCRNAEEAYDAVLNHQIMVVFLDIEMPNVNGLEFLQSLPDAPLVVFTTAYSKFAPKAFDLNAVDYLLKPIQFGRFYQAVEKVQNVLTNPHLTKSIASAKKDFFFVKTEGKLQRIQFNAILYAKAEQEYSYLFTKEKKILMSMHLKKLETILPTDTFLRVHRSYIVPLARVQAIYGNKLQLESGTEIPIGGSFKESVLEKLHIK